MNKINKNMTFKEVLEICPGAVEVFASFKLYCAGCPMAGMESVEQGCKAHGINADELVKKLNERCEKDV